MHREAVRRRIARALFDAHARIDEMNRQAPMNAKNKKPEPYAPPYEVSEYAVGLVAEIADTLARLELTATEKSLVHLRRDNQIKSVHSSCAIENNSLSLEQVSDVINGKRVFGLPREVLEVKNAFDAYTRIEEFAPYNVGSFLKAHGSMMKGLIAAPGKIRASNIGVFAGQRLIHAAPPPELVRGHIRDLFAWAKKSKAHPLIKSAVMHYEIEFIHPFADGNGRMGRFWQTVVLASWNKLFAALPVETIVYKKQQEYYRVLAQSDADGAATKFIDFMLDAILETVKAQVMVKWKKSRAKNNSQIK